MGDNDVSDRQLRDLAAKIPESGLDLNMRMVNTLWGQDSIEVPQSLRDKLTVRKIVVTPDGQEHLVEEDLWAVLSIFTRDLRLGDLEKKDIVYCEHYLGLAGDCLSEGYKSPVVVSLSRAAARLELSQSKGGFFRKLMNTLIQLKEERSMQEPQKRTLFKPEGGGVR